MFDRFARIYARGKYPGFSQEMAAILPSIIKKYKIPTNGTKKLLDVACGEGSFSVEMAKKGWTVTGVDLSDEMLRLAKHRAKQENVQVSYIKQDMRFIDYQNEFDMVTCWFDSLNFLTTQNDLQSAFNSIARSLKPNGWFLFDMNTIYGLAVYWQKERSLIQQETADLLELHSTKFDFEKNLAQLRITWFIKSGALWERYEETFVERAFSIEEIETSLEYAGLHVVEKAGSLNPLAPLTSTSNRAWFLTRK
ncbi:MAG TPA: class I SAM-dependent methyltransferase [Anaerolineaceae bacterium]|nr:class I SAM-dependent methyltransferase [Anaerolineaceae bacterium]